MNPEHKRELIRDAFRRAESFSGWGSFGITQRSLGPPLPWDYDALARQAVAGSANAIDLETGGGERLRSITEPLPPRRLTATEAWHVNAPIAARRLKAVGADVVRCSGEAKHLPFRAGSFDLVLNRHGAVVPSEIDRILQHGGRFLTQQIDPGDWSELPRFFPRTTVWHANDHQLRAAEFEQLGHRVESRRHEYRLAYGSIADLTFNLAVTPWTIPGFAYERDVEALLRLDEELSTGEGLVMTRALNLISTVKLA
jgi:SAM-dependent methyltransferase